jgi:hypothetical protein
MSAWSAGAHTPYNQLLMCCIKYLGILTSGSLGISVMKGKIRGCWAGFARPTPPIFCLTPAIPKEPNKFFSKMYIIVYTQGNPDFRNEKLLNVLIENGTNDVFFAPGVSRVVDFMKVLNGPGS